MKFRIAKSLMALSVIFLVQGCYSQKEEMLAQGYPLSYADGFDDGCHSGNKAGGSLFDQFKKDVNRFDADREYAQGWSDGFRQCESQQEAAQRQMRMNIEYNQLKEAQKSREQEEKRHLEREALKGVNLDGLESYRKK